METYIVEFLRRESQGWKLGLPFQILLFGSVGHHGNILVVRLIDTGACI